MEFSDLSQIYKLYPGVEARFPSVQGSYYKPERLEGNNLEINYCSKGRLECVMHDGCFQYIGEGDLFLSAYENHSDRTELPLGYYSGLSFIVDTSKAPCTMDKFFESIKVDLNAIMNRLFKNDHCYMIQAKPEIQCIFGNSEKIPVQAQGDYARLKWLELMLYLQYFNTSTEKQKKVYGRQQVDIVKQIHKDLTSRPEKRFTIEELSKEYNMSQTAIKEYFKEVYGKPIAAYMKDYRIRIAAKLLVETDKNILEIANMTGYESQSKFSAAFKDIMMITPVEYRKKHSN